MYIYCSIKALLRLFQGSTQAGSIKALLRLY